MHSGSIRANITKPFGPTLASKTAIGFSYLERLILLNGDRGIESGVQESNLCGDRMVVART